LKIKSKVEHNGPAAYIDIITAGPFDVVGLYRVYVGQALAMYHRRAHHYDYVYRKRFPSLQYGILEAGDRRLTMIAFAGFPNSSPEKKTRKLFTSWLTSWRI